jgi:divalent metal cation (Fe/Co/Zn/Cd) transporter
MNDAPRPAAAPPPPCCDDDCCAAAPRPAAATTLSPARAALVRRAFALEYASIAWMLIEAAVAITSGLRAGSLSLLAFGIDSLIEIASAGVLIWRLAVELRQGRAFAEAAERRARRIAGALLLALAAWVVAAAAWKLATRTGQDFSWPGLIIAGLAMPVMAVLARGKLALASALGSRAMRADAIESVTCGWLSLVVVAGLAIEALSGAWWVDAATSLAIVWLLVKEGREAWRGDDCC